MNPLFPIVEAALASTAERSGEWLACKPGCHQCCIGVFPISSLDAESLRTALAQADPARAERILTRATAARARLTPEFPGDAISGELFTHPDHEEAFDDFANEEVCPVLDPTTGTCDLYEARPIQCRTFGPPIRNEDDAFAVCELCFNDAPESEIIRCEMDQSWRTLEDQLIEATPGPNPTLIAFALTQKS